jgi:GAF domain-containing protein
LTGDKLSMLSLEQVAELADAVARPEQPFAVMAAIDRAAKVAIGHDLFTAMRFHAQVMEVERVYSSNPEAYPIGGRKKKLDTAWARDVLLGRRPFIGEGDEEIRQAFDDHALILGLGLRAVINVPIVVAERCYGTLNFLSARHHVEPDAVTTARLLAVVAAGGIIASA